MAFVRGNRQNFDDWAADGAKGWGFSDVLPSFRRLESFEDGPSELRGGDGPIAVERATGLANITKSYMVALAATAGVGMNDDYNGAQQAGVAPIQQSASAGRQSRHRSWVLVGRAAESAGTHRCHRDPGRWWKTAALRVSSWSRAVAAHRWARRARAAR